jgi:hypothetical protein
LIHYLRTQEADPCLILELTLTGTPSTPSARRDVACSRKPAPCRTEHIAGKLASPERDGDDYEARCPACGHGGFRISAPTQARYRNIWTCACKRCRCDKTAIRTALLRLDVSPGCLGSYGTYAKAGTDPAMAVALEVAARDILCAPGLKPSDIRIALAEALGQKVPADYRTFAKWAIGIGVGRSQAYEAAARWCRPPDSPPPPEGGVVDT